MQKKVVTQSWTFWGGLLAVVGTYMQTYGLTFDPEGFAVALGSFGTLMGLRKAIKPDIKLAGSGDTE